MMLEPGVFKPLQVFFATNEKRGTHFYVPRL